MKKQTSSALEGLPLEVLQQDWWVPGSTSRSEVGKFDGKMLFKEILKPTVETCRTWVSRATQDHNFQTPYLTRKQQKKDSTSFGPNVLSQLKIVE